MTNSKNIKRALLTSVLAILACVAMLVGTTFAWFTDSVSTGINKIQSGNLDLAVEYNVNGEWETVEGATNLFSNVDGDPILWEPSASAAETFAIRNAGNLALKYQFVLSYENATVTADGKTLADALSATILEGDDISCSAGLTDLVYEGVLLPGASREFTVGLVWIPTENDNDFNVVGGLSIDLGIHVVATQYTYEKDGFGDQYDAEADFPSVWDGVTTTAIVKAEDGKYHIENAAQLAWLMANTNRSQNSPFLNETFVLERDIDLAGKQVSGIGGHADNVDFVFNGNDHTVSNFVIDGKDDAHKEVDNGTVEYRYAGLFQQFTGTVMNLTVKNATVIGDQMVGVIASNVDGDGKIRGCKVYDSTVIGARKVGAVAGYIAGAGCEISGCYAENVNVYASSTDANQSAAIVGYINNYGGVATVDNETPVKVTVQRGATSAAEGVMKIGSTYEISSVAGLNWFNNQVNNQRNSFNHQTVKLTNDIDMKGAAWLPVGQNFAAADYPALGYANTIEFYGTFDGNGKTISNINITGLTGEQVKALDNTAGYITDHKIYSVGFFGYTNGTVKNLTLKNAQVKGFHYVGAFVGYADTTTYIENCHVENATIACEHLTDEQCGDKAGGIVGFLNDTTAGADIKNCSVKNSTILAGRDAGQVIGCIGTGASVENCTAENVTVSADANCTDASAGNNLNNAIIGRDLR